MTNDEIRYNGLFEALAKRAKEKVSVDEASFVDNHYKLTLSAVYQIRRLGSIDDGKLKKHVNELRIRYCHDKGIEQRTEIVQKQEHERRMKCSQDLTKLVKNADKMPMSEIFEVFSGIIENGFDKISGEKVRAKLSKRLGENAALICQNEGEGYICDLLLMLRVRNDKVSEVITQAKTVGECVEDGFKIKYEGGRFALYKI